MPIKDNLAQIKATLPAQVSLVAVSKTHPVADIQAAYAAGQRIFGESRPQEMAAKHQELPSDIEWHMIGHLQRNKVKTIAPFVALIHSVDSQKLLEEINAEALKNNRVIDILLEIHVAREEEKHGWRASELTDYLRGGSYLTLKGICFRGVMGIASYTDDQAQVRAEFDQLHAIFTALKGTFFDARFDTLSMGMSGDYLIAIAAGSTLVRIGSSIFGTRG